MGNGPEQSEDQDRGLSFEQIHLKYEGKIFNVILRSVGHREDAEDLTVETFSNAWRAWERFRGESKVYTWLYQIALNNCRNYFKKHGRQREREAVSLDEGIETESGELGREVADWTNSPEKVLMTEEMTAQIQKAIASLAPEYRTILVLAIVDGHSYDTIAEMTNLSVPAVKTRLHRAREKMRQRLDYYYRGG